MIHLPLSPTRKMTEAAELIARLRTEACRGDQPNPEVLTEAADHIETLEARVVTLSADGPAEVEIDRLRLAAFKTNSNEDKAAYYLAVSKWFQDRHYRYMDAAREASR